jgi:acylphosphatase
MDSEFRTVQIRVTGKVQGVFYRATAREVAEGLGLKGWVRNCDDGSVEAVAAGPAAALAEFIAWCRRGPEKASVKEVKVNDMEAGKNFEDFSVKR